MKLVIGKVYRYQDEKRWIYALNCVYVYYPMDARRCFGGVRALSHCTLAGW